MKIYSGISMVVQNFIMDMEFNKNIDELMEIFIVNTSSGK